METPTADSLKEKYESILKESQENPNIVGLFLGGARGKDESFITEYSDWDVYVVLADNTPQGAQEKLKKLASPGFELRVFTLSEFEKYAGWGTDREWDKYNFAHNKALVDKTGTIQKIMNEKTVIPADVRKKIIEESLDSYINNVYRSAKYWRDGNPFPAHLDAAESLPFLMDALYTLEGRIKPYNKYFKWELEKYPLKFLPWPPEEFTADYKHILETGDLKTQEKLFRKIKFLFAEHGFAHIIDGWKGYYFVGD